MYSYVVSFEFSRPNVALQLAARGLLYALSQRQDIIYHSRSYTSSEHWLEWEVARWVCQEGMIWKPVAPRVVTLPWSYISLPGIIWVICQKSLAFLQLYTPLKYMISESEFCFVYCLENRKNKCLKEIT